jgi:hypothetical protein
MSNVHEYFSKFGREKEKGRKVKRGKGLNPKKKWYEGKTRK